MRTITLTAPSCWASYFINGDASGLDEDERACADAWIEWAGLGLPSFCEDAGFLWEHDAAHLIGEGADCQKYVFLVCDSEDRT